MKKKKKKEEKFFLNDNPSSYKLSARSFSAPDNCDFYVLRTLILIDIVVVQMPNSTESQ